MTSQLFFIKAIKITQRMSNNEAFSRSKSPQKQYKISVSLSVNIQFEFRQVFSENGKQNTRGINYSFV